jgi:hypothetical protein
MDQEIEDDEALLEGEVGLVGVDVVSGAPGDPGEERLPDRALLEHALDRAKRGLEAEVLVHHQRHAGPGAGLDHRPAVVDRRRERLLHDYRHALRGRELDQAAVARHGGDHVDEVGPLGREHRPRIGVPAGDAERVGRGRRLGCVEVADRGQLDVFDGAPGVQMVLREEAAADHRTPEPVHRPPPQPDHAPAQPSRAGAARKRPRAAGWRDGASSPMMDSTKSRGGDR